MKHIKKLSRTPNQAQDIPVADLMTFIIALLTAMMTLLEAKETTAA